MVGATTEIISPYSLASGEGLLKDKALCQYHMI